MIKRVVPALLLVGAVVLGGTFLNESEASPGANEAGFSNALVTTPDVNVTSVSTDSVVKTSTFTVVVTCMGTKKWRDLHVYSGQKLKFPKLISSTGTSTSVGDGTNPAQNWNVSRSSAGNSVHVHTGTSTSSPGGFGDGTYTFTIHWDTKTFDKAKTRAVTWYASSNGAKNKPTSSSNIINDDGGKTPVSVPQATVSMHSEDPPQLVGIGQTSTLPAELQNSFASDTYEYYSSVKLSTDYSDSLGIGIASSTKPIPSSWAISFNSRTGTVGTGGEISPAASIVLPSDSGLIGKTIYMVLAVKDENGDILYSSEPATLKIVE